jgi:stress response protein YsnF
MTETAEEAVIAKEARVREELVVRKTAEERTESIDETIRTTEVEVEEGAQRSGSTSAFGFNEQRSDKKGL